MRELKLGLLAAACAAMAACSSAPEVVKTPESVHIANALAGAPEWVVGDCKKFLSNDKALCASGAMGGSRNVSLLKSGSANRARTELARQLQLKVKSMLRDYQRTVTGGSNYGKSADDEQLVEDTSKTITDQTLSGATIDATWVSQTGELWSLAVMDVEKFAKSLEGIQQLDAAVRDYIAHNAENAFAGLDEEIGNERSAQSGK